MQNSNFICSGKEQRHIHARVGIIRKYWVVYFERDGDGVYYYLGITLWVAMFRSSLSLGLDSTIVSSSLAPLSLHHYCTALMRKRRTKMVDLKMCRLATAQDGSFL